MKYTGKNHPWVSELSDLYRFIEESRKFVKGNFAEHADVELISEIKKIIEVDKVSFDGKSHKDIKFDSAIYRDIGQIALMKNFLKKFQDSDLKRYQTLIDIEINGLEGDVNPRTILTSTVPAAVITGLSLAAIWSALGAVYFGIDLTEIFVDTLMSKLTNISWLRGILSVVFVIGGFLGITWYVTGLYKNQKQLMYLKSLDRAISLRLAIENGPEED